MTDETLPVSRPRLEAGDAITRWLYTEAEEVEFVGPRRPNPDYVSYEFGLAGERTGQSPARERLVARSDPAEDTPPTGPFDALHVGSLSPNVDFSLFAYTPKLITRALKCRLVAQAAGSARFQIATCGEIRLWLDGKLVAEFAPFTQNNESAREIELELPAEPVELIVELQDLHERNTDNFFSVAWLSGVPVVAGIAQSAEEELSAVADAMDRLEASRLCFDDHRVTLSTSAFSPVEIDIEINSIRQKTRCDCSDGTPQAPVRVTLEAGARDLRLPVRGILPTGCVVIELQTRFGGIRILRRIGTTILTRAVPLTGGTVSARRRRC